MEPVPKGATCLALERGQVRQVGEDFEIIFEIPILLKNLEKINFQGGIVWVCE